MGEGNGRAKGKRTDESAFVLSCHAPVTATAYTAVKQDGMDRSWGLLAHSEGEEGEVEEEEQDGKQTW